MQLIHLKYTFENPTVRAFQTDQATKRIMTLMYVLMAFAGITGAAIAKDDFAKMKAPKTTATKKC